MLLRLSPHGGFLQCCVPDDWSMLDIEASAMPVNAARIAYAQINGPRG
jgi:hypothetical protein